MSLLLGASEKGTSVGRCCAPAVLPEVGEECFHKGYSTKKKRDIGSKSHDFHLWERL